VRPANGTNEKTGRAVQMNNLSDTGWNCKYHITVAPKYRRKAFCGEKRREFWRRGDYANTAGKNAKKIAEYIQNQLKEDQIYDQMTLKEYDNPFTGSK
jgi:REP element-mobilizing transposase RayT